MISSLVGPRETPSANECMLDVASRVVGRFQLVTDALSAYQGAVWEAFDEIDYAQLIKIYNDSSETGPERKYSPPECIGIRKRRVFGNPDMSRVSTSLVEKHNQTMRQQMKRFGRLTAAHSKKLENHCHMIALYTVWYNFARINAAVKTSPAMSAGLTDKLWDVADIVNLIDAAETGQLT